MGTVTEIIALVSAFTIGASDFLGSQATRKNRAELVPFLTHVSSLGFITIAIWFMAAPNIGAADLWWGASGGISGGLGIYLLFRSMAHGQISVVAPIAAVSGSLTTVVFGVAVEGDRPVGVARVLNPCMGDEIPNRGKKSEVAHWVAMMLLMESRDPKQRCDAS